MAVVGGVRAAVAVEHGEVQQVVLNAGHAETVLVLLPQAQHRGAADPRQADLRQSHSPVSVPPSTSDPAHTRPVTCGMAFPYLMLEGSSIGSSTLSSQMPKDSQATGRPLPSPWRRTEPLARRTPTTPNSEPPTYRAMVQTKVRLRSPGGIGRVGGNHTCPGAAGDSVGERTARKVCLATAERPQRSRFNSTADDMADCLQQLTTPGESLDGRAERETCS